MSGGGVEIFGCMHTYIMCAEMYLYTCNSFTLCVKFNEDF